MKLSVVIGTYNRLNLLKNCITSICSQTKNEVKVYVSDAGSTDGTIEYLKSIASEKVIPLFVGRKIGQARALNEVFALVETPYVSWLSDDNVVVNEGLDTALKILGKDPNIGMVALKIKDVQGPFIQAPYIGGISSIGILNVNQGVLPTEILKRVGGFSEEFRDYGIDPDLTAKVLFEGYKIVYTKKISLHHYRGWADDKDSAEYHLLKQKQDKSLELYNNKFSAYLKNSNTPNPVIAEKAIANILKNKLFNKKFKNASLMRDFYNILHGRYISSFDLLKNVGRKHYLVQNPPVKLYHQN